MKIWKMVTLVTVITLLSLFVQTAQAEYVDLNKEKVLLAGVCHIFKKKYPCLSVEHKGKMYLVVFDRKGEAYQIELLPNGTYLIKWTRDTV